MDRTLSFVKDLSCAKDMWNMKVRIIKKWKQSFRLDMIFIDKQGQKVQACVRSDLISDFEDLLKEDGVYILRKFGVGQQKDQYPVTTNEMKVNFFRCTEVTPAKGWTGHPYGFTFWKFNDILEKKAARARTVDVMGILAWCGNLDIFKTENKESKRINFELQDYGSTALKCTMWDDYAVQFNNYIVGHNSTEMIIVIIQHAKIKEWNGNLTVQNDMFGTRVFIDEDLDEDNVFRRGLILRDGASASQSQLSSQTVYPLRREFLVETERKTVDSIIETTKDPQQAVEGCSVKLSESSQCVFDSKDVASVTGDSLAGNAEKDDAISPPGKRSAAAVPVDVQAPTTKRIKKKLIPYI